MVGEPRVLSAACVAPDEKSARSKRLANPGGQADATTTAPATEFEFTLVTSTFARITKAWWPSPSPPRGVSWGEEAIGTEVEFTRLSWRRPSGWLHGCRLK
jgi:hypothetical protein